MTKQKILVVGGGFGGVKVALELAEHPELSITLLSDRPTFRYYPALYHTATGGLKEQSSIPLEDILQTHPELDITLEQGTATTLDRTGRHLITQDGRRFHYDQLILALGSVTNYFGIQGLEKYSYGVKSATDVQKFKAHLHQQLIDERKPDLNYVVVGAGPTGIELAGALPSYLRQIMDNHGIKHRAIHVDLIEAGPRLLPRAPRQVSRAITRQLKRVGVHLYTNAKVEGQSAEALMVSGKPITSHSVVWTAGMANHPFFKANNFALNERGKVTVNEYLQAEKRVYVIGDNAATQYSGMAQTALNDADFLAHNVARELRGKRLKRYQAIQPISVIPAGPYWASVQWGKLTFSGKRGWLLRQAADWIGFHDLEPWWPATEQYMTEFGEQESCPVCVKAAVS